MLPPCTHSSTGADSELAPPHHANVVGGRIALRAVAHGVGRAPPVTGLWERRQFLLCSVSAIASVGNRVDAPNFKLIPACESLLSSQCLRVLTRRRAC